MSYAGTYGADETCKHDAYWRNCGKCIREKQKANGTMLAGILHSDNGSGWCVGHIKDGRCVVLVRHCPVLNTPEQVVANRREDYEAEVVSARAKVQAAAQEYANAQVELDNLVKRGGA